tara:strand:- start:2024 stop:2344 length:321 start_codon:yes stop_codon:yes gene_type:complete
MKLLTKEIKNKAHKQYELGSDMDKQDIVAKFFNPVGQGTWYLMNKSPEDGYCWGIVDLMAVEVGSFMIEDLEDLELPMGMKIERDKYFEPINANKLFEQLVRNKVH